MAGGLEGHNPADSRDSMVLILHEGGVGGYFPELSLQGATDVWSHRDQARPSWKSYPGSIFMAFSWEFSFSKGGVDPA